MDQDTPPPDFVIASLTAQLDLMQRQLSEVDQQRDSIVALLDFHIQDATLALKRLPQFPTGYAEIDNARGTLNGRLAALEAEKRGTLVKFRQEHASWEREIEKLRQELELVNDV